MRPTFQECWTRSCHSIRRAVHTQKLLRDRHTRTSVYVPVSHFNTKLETSLHAIWAWMALGFQEMERYIQHHPRI